MSLHVYLSGPMGVGKSTVGPLLARLLGASFVDLDVAIEEEAGASVAELFRERGEAAFRALERGVVDRLSRSSDRLVVALGGGAVEDDETRARLLERGLLVTLEAPLDELVRRLGAGPKATRPLFAGGDAREVLARLLARRAPAYAEAHHALDTAGRSPEEVARELAAWVPIGEGTVPIRLGSRSYRVIVGEGQARGLAAELSRLGARTLVVVTDANVRALAERWLGSVSAELVWVVLEPGEGHKTLAAVERIWDAALSAHVDRRAVVVAVGGGVVGDLAAFAASTLLRGLRLVSMPTSLLAMVDSSVGGKTGFDRPEGKNLVGTFHQPSVVLVDLDALGTLPRRELVAGLAEVVKAAWIEGEEDVSALEEDARSLLGSTPEGRDAQRRAILRAIRTKARVVAADEREAGLRRVLNLGHTLGHAVEAASGYALVHGEAVAIGLVAAMRVSRALGVADARDVQRLTRLLERLELPVEWPRVELDAVKARLRSDKKAEADAIHLVVAGAPGAVSVRRVPLGELLSFVERLAARDPLFC